MEFASCPAEWTFSHFAEGVEDPAVGFGSSIQSTLTVAPCSRDLGFDQAFGVSVRVSVTNEFESTIGRTVSVSCWRHFSLSDPDFLGVFDPGTAGSLHLRTRLSSTTTSGFIAQAIEHRDPGGAGATPGAAAIPMQSDGVGSSDSIALPVVP